MGVQITPEGWKLFAETSESGPEDAEALNCPRKPRDRRRYDHGRHGGQKRPTPKQWLNKAVADEIDYMPAYDKLRWALRPRWCGSHEAMYRFGCQCADTRRYDTLVPSSILQVVGDIDQESDSTASVASKGVDAKAKQVLEGMANEPSRADASGRYPRK